MQHAPVAAVENTLQHSRGGKQAAPHTWAPHLQHRRDELPLGAQELLEAAAQLGRELIVVPARVLLRA